MVKEKIIFIALVPMFIGVVIFGFVSQGFREEAARELLEEIDLATRKSRAKVNAAKDRWDFDRVKGVDTIDGYTALLKRSPFFKIKPKVKKKIEKSKEPVESTVEEPKEPLFKYKGKVVMGSNVMVIIEDQGTGKSSFVQEGSMIGDYLVVLVNDREVTLKKKGGEEIVLSTVKKESEPEEKKDIKGE